MKEINVYSVIMDGELLKNVNKLRIENAALSLVLIGVCTASYKLLKLTRKVVLENAELKNELERYSNGEEK